MKLPIEYHVMIPIERGMKGVAVRLVQEWLCLHDCHCRIDGDFGPATQAAVRKLQTKYKLHPTGVVDEETMRTLIAPMTKSLRRLYTTAESFSERVVSAARQHLKWHPREVGGQNQGPWVRLYAGEKSGEFNSWNAAFVSHVIRQAQDKRSRKRSPIDGSNSCNELVRHAREAQIFVPEELLKNGTINKEELGPGTIFAQRSRTDQAEWINVGVVTGFYGEFMETIEANIHADGCTPGHEVCKRVRGYAGIDYIKL
ncbi:MAG: peptidoglycan-binding protein [Ignavibacteria bacterium]|nr:peptidoglycan-binding protein [Ignavibacteria bacterium]